MPPASSFHVNIYSFLVMGINEPLLLMKNMVLTRIKSDRTFVKDDVAYLIRRNVSSKH